MKPQGYIPSSASPSAHEGADLNPSLVASVVGILAATMVSMVLLLGLLFHNWSRTYGQRISQAAPIVRTADLPPQPRLQVDPRRDLDELRAREDKHLLEYGWVDRTRGLARIPIDRAMVLWVKEYRPDSSSPGEAGRALPEPPKNIPTAGEMP